MALSDKQLWTATKVDTKVRKLLATGKDDVAIMVAMADHMPAFKQLMDTAGRDDMDELTRRFVGFYRYAKILEALAAGIQSGDIEVPR